ncbi:MAG: CPBP family intramembrane metalloprotease [Oxalobacteraceae bacterium]|nr:MAG: CPBP family intramembrane metalloprotease [Oxalobacteraceae bacterium]
MNPPASSDLPKPPKPSTAARPPIRLSAQVLTCLVMCLIAASIIWFTQDAPLAVFTRPAAPMWQLVIGQGLALLAAAVSYGLYRLGASSESTARTIATYARLDLAGFNPLWMALAAAIGEEMLFRAALQPLLGVWIVSLLFLVTHVPVYRFRKLDRASLVQAAGVFGSSVVLGLVFQYVGLIAAILVHLWIDIVGLLVVRAAIRSRTM